MSNITLESLIVQGNNILSGIEYSPPNSGVYRMYSAYSLKDYGEYTEWKHKTIRFLSSKYPQDSYLSELTKLFEEFEKHHNSQSIFMQILGLMQAYKDIPESIVLKDGSHAPLVEVNNNLSQYQSQTINFIVDIIKDELTGKQLKDLKEILESKAEVEAKKKSIFDKIKSFGSDIAASIVANIVTNPNILDSLF